MFRPLFHRSSQACRLKNFDRLTNPSARNVVASAVGNEVDGLVDVCRGCFIPRSRKLLGGLCGKENATKELCKVFEQLAELDELSDVEEVVYNWYIGDFDQNVQVLDVSKSIDQEIEESQDDPDGIEERADANILGQSMNFILDKDMPEESFSGHDQGVWTSSAGEAD